MAWYKCNTTQTVLEDNGSTTPNVPYTYLVDALSVTEAAAYITERLEGEAHTIEGVTRMRLKEVIRSGAHWVKPFFLGKVILTTLSEESGTERRQTLRYLIEADDLAAALERLQEEFKGTVSDWELVSLSKSPIVEVVTANKKQEGAA